MTLTRFGWGNVSARPHLTYVPICFHPPATLVKVGILAGVLMEAGGVSPSPAPPSAVEVRAGQAATP